MDVVEPRCAHVGTPFRHGRERIPEVTTTDTVKVACSVTCCVNGKFVNPTGFGVQHDAANITCIHVIPSRKIEAVGLNGTNVHELSIDLAKLTTAIANDPWVVRDAIVVAVIVYNGLRAF